MGSQYTTAARWRSVAEGKARQGHAGSFLPLRISCNTRVKRCWSRGIASAGGPELPGFLADAPSHQHCDGSPEFESGIGCASATNCPHSTPRRLFIKAGLFGVKVFTEGPTRALTASMGGPPRLLFGHDELHCDYVTRASAFKPAGANVANGT